MLEKHLQTLLLNYLRSKSIFCWTNQTTGIFDKTKGIYRKNKSRHFVKGVSDILGVLPDGKFLAIEVKSKTGRASVEQLRFINTINSQNGIAFIARSIDDINKHLASYI